MPSSLPPYEPQPSYLRGLMHDYHQQINAQTDATVADLQQRWVAARAAINADIARLEQQMETAIAHGDQITYAWLADAQRLAALKASVEGNIAQFADGVRQLVADGQLSALDLGTSAAQDALAATVPPGLSYTFGVPPADVLHAQAGALSPNSPLTALFAQLGPDAAKSAQAALFTSVALGEGPRAAATRLFWNTNLSRQRAEVIARTEIMRSWRGAQMENYRANQDVVSGWQWSADFSDRTCFPAGTLIQTRQGLIPIEQVRVGDEALTHSGRYRPVLDVMARDYRGEMVTLWAGAHQVTATSDHPFLVERQGKLDWIEAGHILLTDRVVCQVERGAHVGHHIFGHGSVEGRIRQPHHAIAATLEHDCLSQVSLGPVVDPLMPVHAVNFQHGIEARDIEVDRIAPARHRKLLLVLDAERLKAFTRSSLRLRLSSMCAVTTHGAVAIHLGRLREEVLAACLTSDKCTRRLAARIRTMLNVYGRHAEDRATGVARAQRGRSALAGYRAEASEARLNSRRANVERFTARLADALDAWLAQIIALPGMPALAATVNPRRIAMRVLGERWLATVGADARDLLHNSVTTFSSIIPQNIVVNDDSVTVYNLTVAQDHSYIANGFVVHNCGACIALDGTIHTLDEDLDDHIMGRCSALPITRPWSDILAGTGADTSGLTETSIASWDSYLYGKGFARDWFEGLAPEVQNSILGPAKAEAYRAGDITLNDLAGVRKDALWGDSIQEVSLKQLGLDAQDYLAAARANGTDSMVADAEALAQAAEGTPAAMAAALAATDATEAAANAANAAVNDAIQAAEFSTARVPVQQLEAESARALDAIHPAEQTRRELNAQVAQNLGAALADNPAFAALSQQWADAVTQQFLDAGYEARIAQDAAALVPKTPEDMARMLTSIWSSTGSPLYPLMQDAVGAEFGLTNVAALPETEALAKARAAYGELLPGLQAFVREMYSQTQDWLDANGITELPIYRGMGFAALPAGLPVSLFDGTTQEVSLALRAASSFSADVNQATKFAQMPVGLLGDTVNYEQVVAARVPAVLVLSTPQTGFGALNEYEVVVLGGQYDVVSIGADMTGGSSAITPEQAFFDLLAQRNGME